MKILMMAGEVSGDYQASFLARALKRRCPDLEILGTGGRHMRKVGVKLIRETSHLSSVGLLEPVRHLAPLRSVYRDIERVLEEGRPSLAVLVDNQGFNLAVAKALKRHNIPVVFYFPPQIWVAPFLFARSVARLSRLVISAFPPEAEIYRTKYGANAVSFGHPLLDIVSPTAPPDDALRRAGIDPSRPVMALMPGSRDQEVRGLAGPMVDAYELICRARPGMQCIIPVAGDHVRPRLEETRRRAGRHGVAAFVESDTYSCLSRCEVVLTCCGTATLELSLLRVPMVAAYRLDPFSHCVARALALTEFVAMPNVLLDEGVVPEVIAPRMKGRRLAEKALELLDDPSRARRLREKLAEIPGHLGAPGAVERAADRVLEEAGRGGAGR